MLNAVGQAQHILLLGGTSEIGLAIVSELVSRGGNPTVTLCARKDSPRIDDAIAQVQHAGAGHVHLVDFDALDFASHPAVIEAALRTARSTSPSSPSAPWVTRSSSGRTRLLPSPRRRPTSPPRCRSVCCWARR